MLLALSQPILAKIVEQPAKEMTVVDVLLGSIGLIGLLLMIAAMAGLALGGVLVWIQKRRGRALEHSVQQLLH